MKNTMNVSAEEFNIEALETVLKDVRNTRKALLAISTGREETETKRDEAQVELQKAIDEGDLEGMTKHTNELRNAMKKLQEKPDAKQLAFDNAVDRLVAFTENNDDTLDGSADETVKADLKVAA